MKRRLSTILSALSLLLCVAVVALWVRSHWRRDTIEHFAPGVVQGMISTQGSISFGRQQDVMIGHHGHGGWFYESHDAASISNYVPNGQPNLRLAGFSGIVGRATPRRLTSNGR